MPGATGRSRPSAAAGTMRSRFGVRAASSGVRHSCAEFGTSPTPSSTSSTILLVPSSTSPSSTDSLKPLPPRFRRPPERGNLSEITDRRLPTVRRGSYSAASISANPLAWRREAMAIRKVGVVGCGLMGSGIAQISAQAGFPTVVRETSKELLDKGLASVMKFLEAGVAKGKVAQFDLDKVK